MNISDTSKKKRGLKIIMVTVMLCVFTGCVTGCNTGGTTDNPDVIETIPLNMTQIEFDSETYEPHGTAVTQLYLPDSDKNSFETGNGGTVSFLVQSGGDISNDTASLLFEVHYTSSDGSEYAFFDGISIGTINLDGRFYAKGFDNIFGKTGFYILYSAGKDGNQYVMFSENGGCPTELLIPDGINYIGDIDGDGNGDAVSWRNIYTMSGGKLCKYEYSIKQKPSTRTRKMFT